MSTLDDSQLSPTVVRRIFRYLSLDWLSLVLDLAQYLRRLLCARPSCPYEILDYEASVELLDTKGKKALFKKRQQVRFLQNNVIAIEDYVWGDGEILADYRCTPGVVVDKYREGDRWNLLISLRETKSSGDIEQFHVEQQARNTYRKHEEWLQTEIRRPTRRLRMSVTFPQKRGCQRAVLVQRSANRTTELGPEHFDILPDGRQMLAWGTNHAKGYEVYTLRWWW